MFKAVIYERATMNKEGVYKLIEIHYRENYKRTIKYISSNAGSRHNAEDILQETYMRALKYWASLEIRNNDSMNKWFRGILRNCFKDYKIDLLEKGITTDQVDRIEGNNHPGYVKRWFGEIEKKISSRNDRDKYILNLYFLNQFKIGEIVDLVPETFFTIRKLVANFRKELREEYGK